MYYDESTNNVLRYETDVPTLFSPDHQGAPKGSSENDSDQGASFGTAWPTLCWQECSWLINLDGTPQGQSISYRDVAAML
jgi:hypothetical protein